jgi:hypothetical protein
MIADRHIMPVKIVKIGSEERPASEEDIQDVQEQLANVANDPLLTIVTHHNFSLDWFGSNGKILPVTNEFENIDQNILDGMMINKALLNGEGPAYNAAGVGLQFTQKRLEKFRSEVKYWIEEKLFKPVAEWNGFTVEGKAGEQQLIYPTIKWGDLKLSDDTNKLQVMLQMYDKGVIPAQTLIEAIGEDYDDIIEKLRFEQMSNFIGNPGWWCRS